MGGCHSQQSPITIATATTMCIFVLSTNNSLLNYKKVAILLYNGFKGNRFDQFYQSNIIDLQFTNICFENILECNSLKQDLIFSSYKGIYIYIYLYIESYCMCVNDYNTVYIFQKQLPMSSSKQSFKDLKRNIKVP